MSRVCSRCLQRREPEAFVGKKGLVSHCLHCREKARMARQEKKHRHATERYSLEYCPWYAGEIRMERYGGQGLL